ncbi:MAG: peptide/nickel transport system permease protein [Actinomycetota bacterium]|nr:peptide/nickel transport system permease protein [Actinomycetota bacterium]
MASPGGGSLRAYVLARLLLAVPMLFILLTVTFVLLRVAPGDPVTATLGGRVSDERAAQIRHDLGLDRPLWRQYTSYLGDVGRGDFGRAITTNRPLRTTIADRFPATLELTLAAMVVAVGVGVLVGAVAARFRDTPLDVGGRLLGIVLYAAPIFWLGIMLQLLFSIRLGWLPTGGRIGPFLEPRSITRLYLVDSVLTGNRAALGSALRYLVLPAVTLGIVIGGIFIRLVRVNMLQTLKSDYVEAARARGIGERRVLFNHAFRNALVPVVTIVGLQFALLLSGAVLTEATFTWPGIGLSLYQFLQNRDYTAVQGLVTFYALFVVVVSLLIDLVSAWVDPRIRFQ